MSKLAALAAIALTSLVSLSTTGCAADSDEPLEEEVDESGDAIRRGSSGIEGNEVEPSEIASLLREAGVPAASINKMVCTAFYESRWHDRSYNWRNNNGTIDRGLFQINSVHLQRNGLCDDITAEQLWNPAKNAECASRVLKAQGLSAWYGYRAHRTTKVVSGIRQLGCDVYKVGDTIESRR